MANRTQIGDILANHSEMIMQRVLTKVKEDYRKKFNEVIEDYRRKLNEVIEESKKEWSEQVEAKIKEALKDISLDIRQSVCELEPKTKIEFLCSWIKPTREEK